MRRPASPRFALLAAAGVLAAASAVLPARGFADVVRARRDGVKVFAEASSQAAVVATLRKDEAVTMRHRHGSFFAIDLPGPRIGYVRFLEVAKVEGDKAEELRKEIERRVGKAAVPDAGGAARERAATSVMGVRGLGADADASARTNVRPDMRAVRAMDARVPSEQRLDALEKSIFAEIEALEKTRGAQDATQGEE